MRSRPQATGPRPRKALGQHFLLDEELASRIVQSMQLSWEERALEIGPGRGVLLRFLLKACRRVTAIELDLRMAKSLQRVFGGHPGLDLIFDDFLKFDLGKFLLTDAAPVKIVGNIPYSLSSPILFRLFETAEELTDRDGFPLISATLMLQKEVAQRLCALPGGRDYGAITLLRSLVADADLLFQVPPTAFWPLPRVRSAVIRLTFSPVKRFQIADRIRFGQLVHHVFAQRRKMLKNTLTSFYGIKPDWPTVDFDFTRRPEELSTVEFIQLYEQILS